MVAGPHVVITVLGPTIACRSRLTDIDPTETIIMIIANYYVENYRFTYKNRFGQEYNRLHHSVAIYRYCTALD